MTIAVIKNSILYTDSMTVTSLGKGTNHQLVEYGEKAMKDPEGRWMYMESGTQVEDNSLHEWGIKKCVAALPSFFRKLKEPGKIPTLAEEAGVSDDNFSLYIRGALITKELCWVPSLSSMPVKTDKLTWVEGSGCIPLIALLNIHGNVKKAIEEVSSIPYLCVGGKIHTYNLKRLKPYNIA